MVLAMSYMVLAVCDMVLVGSIMLLAVVVVLPKVFGMGPALCDMVLTVMCLSWFQHCQQCVSWFEQCLHDLSSVRHGSSSV